jgi:hypothetical protein
MKLRASTLGSLLVGIGAAVIAAPAAGQLELGGSVPSLVALSIGTAGGFTRVAGSDVYDLRIPVDVTSTLPPTHLSIADGEDFSGPARGHLHDGAHLVAAPLEAAVAGHAPQPLSAPADPLLEVWSKAITSTPATVTLSQVLPRGSITNPRLHKVVWITISSETP